VTSKFRNSLFSNLIFFKLYFYFCLFDCRLEYVDQGILWPLVFQIDDAYSRSVGYRRWQFQHCRNSTQFSPMYVLLTFINILGKLISLKLCFEILR